MSWLCNALVPNILMKKRHELFCEIVLIRSWLPLITINKEVNLLLQWILKGTRTVLIPTDILFQELMQTMFWTVIYVLDKSISMSLCDSCPSFMYHYIILGALYILQLLFVMLNDPSSLSNLHTDWKLSYYNVCWDISQVIFHLWFNNLPSNLG